MSYPPGVGVGDSGTLPPGATLGRYEIRRPLGAGGAGKVYEAVHRELKKRVAIKTLPPGPAVKPATRERFDREATAASRVRHPGLVDITEVVTDGPMSYFVMELLEGETLAQLIARKGALGAAETADIMLPVVAAIATAHEHGTIHRGLTPENIFLARSAQGGVQPKVLNLGMSKAMDAARTMALVAAAAPATTPSYLAPEQVRNSRASDARSDQYSLATIIYECLTGRRAFEGENEYATLRIISAGACPAPRSWRPELPVRLDALVTRGMSLDPAARFETVQQLGAPLLEFASPGVAALWRPYFTGQSSGPPVMAQAGRTLALGNQEPERRSAPRPSQRRSRPIPTLERGSRKPPRRSRAPLVLLLLVLGAAGGLLAADYRGFKLWRQYLPPQIAGTVTGWLARIEPQTSYRIDISTEPRDATLELDGRPAGSGSLIDRLPADGSPHTVVVRASGYAEATVHFSDRALPPRLVALTALPPPAAEAPPRDQPAPAARPPAAPPAADDAAAAKRSRKASRRHHARAHGHAGTAGTPDEPGAAPDSPADDDAPASAE